MRKMKEHDISSDTRLVAKFTVQIWILSENFFQLLIVTYVLLVHIATYASLFFIPFFLWIYPGFRLFFIAYLAWVYYSSKRSLYVGMKRSWNRWNSMKDHYRQYFPVKLIKTVDLPSNQNYLLVLYPHSLQAHSVIINFLIKSAVVDSLFPGIDFHVVTLRLYFYLPILREHLLLAGACPASESTLTTLLQVQPSKAVVLLAGGAREMSLQRPGTTYTIIKNRKGFVRIAIKTGTPLVPSFSFGENRIFDYYHIKWSLLTKVVDIVHRITGLRIVFPRGRGLFQSKFGLLPKRSPIYTVVGKPIMVPKMEKPSVELVDEYHEIFFQALGELFDEHKTYYDPEGCNARLVMV